MLPEMTIDEVAIAAEATGGVALCLCVMTGEVVVRTCVHDRPLFHLQNPG